MIKLADALSQRFPQGNQWATQALGALAGEFDSSTLVHEICEGWMRRGEGADAELIDTLFIVTNDRLGLGQTNSGAGDPRWIPLSAIIAVDAVDDSPLPLQTIEIELSGGLAMCVGWPDDFSQRLVDVLIALAEGTSIEEGDAETMPAELVDPSALVDDASGLDSMPPSGWVEPVVVDPGADTSALDEPTFVDVDVEIDADADADADVDVDVIEEIDAQFDDDLDAGFDDEIDTRFVDTELLDVVVAETDPDTDADAADDLEDLPAPAGPRPIVAALDFFNPAPAPAPQPVPDSPWLAVDSDLDGRPLDPDAFEISGPFDAGASGAAFEPGAAFSAEPHRPAAFTEAERFDPAAFEEWIEPLAPSSAPAEPTTSAGPPPWNLPGMVWPDPLRGVQYLGGHPGHPRKRKNGTMVFSPHGLDVAGSGFQSWEMSIDWAYVEAIEIQGPDEVMFGDNIKVDSTSSALVVTMVDETRMFFEVRTRRPPSLRAALAPVLLMVENIRSHRAHS